MYPIFKPQKTIEFRCFFPTVDPDEIKSIFEFVIKFTQEALSETPTSIESWGPTFQSRLPKEKKYNHELEVIWQSTNYKFNTREVANSNRELLRKTS